MNRAMLNRYERIVRMPNSPKLFDLAPLLDPPEPAAPEGFLLPAARPNRTIRQSPERETRISGLALERRVPKRAGPAGGNEAMSRAAECVRTVSRHPPRAMASATCIPSQGKCLDGGRVAR